MFAEIRRVSRVGAQLLMLEPVLPGDPAAAAIVSAHYKIIDELRCARAGSPDCDRTRGQHYRTAAGWVAAARSAGFSLVAESVAVCRKNTLTSPGDTICMLFALEAAAPPACD
jgi:hypothetical protein